ASTMQCMSQALELALPGSALLSSTLAEIRRVAGTAGHHALYLAQKNITTHKILTPAAFENAIKVHAAIGGSTNAMIHLLAIAHELGWELNPELVDRINNEIPYLTKIQHSGEYVTEMMWFAGVMPIVQWYLCG
ncbi:dihydroxy-acid dehydratase, partial [Salmonella enterica]|uniref:dihydroxy-acid dehydratase domain-containing protein n=1 Tax=Salmonella enterica TaxID=28901 RepID=UPI00398C5E11